MPVTAKAGGFHGYGQPGTSNSAEVLSAGSPITKLVMSCSECEPPEPANEAEVFCAICKVLLCAECDTKVVHTSKTTRQHERIDIAKYIILERALGGSSSIGDIQIDAYYKNKFCYFSPVDNRIRLEPLLASLVEDPEAQPSLVSFIGPTGVGKSTLLRTLLFLDGVTDENCWPVAGTTTNPQSTSADIHMYASGTETYPLLYVDSEGRGGSKEPHAIERVKEEIRKFFVTGKQYEEYRKARFSHVQTSYPRMLYIFSDVLCFVFSGDWREQESIVNPLLEWGQTAAVGAANQHQPQLILIFNKTGEEAKMKEYEDSRKTYKTWMEKAGNRRRDELERYYSDPQVFLIPQKAINVATVFDRVKKLREEIVKSTQKIRATREEANQLFTRRQLQFYMQLAADAFSPNPTAEFDIYKASMARRPTSFGREAWYIVEFRRAVEEAASYSPQYISNSEKYQISLSFLKMRIKHSVHLWFGRNMNLNLPLGPNAELPNELRTALEEAQKVIDAEMPCAAIHGLYGRIVDCRTLRGMHANGFPHASSYPDTMLAWRWAGAFTPDPTAQDALKACQLVHIAKSALQSGPKMDVKAIRQLQLKDRQSECDDQYPWLRNFTSDRACPNCMLNLPTEVLSCGHMICDMCAEEGSALMPHTTRSPKLVINMTCPVCLYSAKWYPRNLPPLAGYRTLSLDGGGVRGIVELLSLEAIMFFFPGMNVEDLFDIIIGTSTGGIIALALTVHKPDKPPMRLPDVIELFKDLASQVFSSESALRPFAGNRYLLRLFQVLGFYDTKYKNDNLLTFLKQHLGEQSLLRSCVGGPHVIITSCDIDNKLAAAWFTSYNCPSMLGNESDDQLQNQAHRGENEWPDSKLLVGRVLDNHRFTAMEAAAATSSAPTYFPVFEAGGRRWVDGGMRFNGPLLIAIKEARTMWSGHRASAAISLGCGRLDEEKGGGKGERLGLLKLAELVVNVALDAETQSNQAIEYLRELHRDHHPGPGLRLNPTIVLPEGETCELDDAMKIEFLTRETKKYLKSTEGAALVQRAANLLFAALFYLDVEFDQDSQQPKLDKLHIRSRAPLPKTMRDAFTESARSTLRPPFSVVVSGTFEFFWEECTWDQNVMDLPFRLGGLPMMRPLTVVVNLQMCLPNTPSGFQQWSLPISGMPYILK